MNRSSSVGDGETSLSQIARARVCGGGAVEHRSSEAVENVNKQPSCDDVNVPTMTQRLSFINTKNCSLSVVLTATDQKPQKSLKR